MKKFMKIIFVVMFCGILLSAFATTNFGKNVVSEIDNRKLKEFPKLFEENFTQDFEMYIKDRIGGRNFMINGYAIFNDVVANELTHPSYTYGQDDYVFFEMHKNEEYGDFQEDFANMVLKLQNYCEERGTKFYFIFDPEKISVYREYLPEGVNYNDEWVKQMFSYMDELGIHYVDNTALLREKAKNESVFNKQYDAGHWNDLGCYYATNALLELMQKDNPNIELLTKDMFNISYVTQKALPNSEFPISEEVPSFALKTDYKDITEKWRSEVKLNPNYRHFHYYINEADKADVLPKTLVFQGSYYNRGPQFLLSSTSQYIGVHNYQNVLDFDYYYNIFQPDVVILDAAEYVFSDQYFDSEMMENLDLNPALIDYNEPVDTQITSIMNSNSFVSYDAKVDVVEGESVDKIVADVNQSDAQYVYLVTGDKILDMKKSDGSLYEASCEHGTVESKDSIIVIKDFEGNMYYMNAEVRKGATFTDNVYFSEGIYQKEGKLYFTTDVKNNEFNKLAAQLVDAESNEYLETIADCIGATDYNIAYLHEKESGWYTVRLKANSNQQDEYADFVTYLVKGEKYSISLNIDSQNAKEIVVSDYEVKGLDSTVDLKSGAQSQTKGCKKNDGNEWSYETRTKGNNFGSAILSIKSDALEEINLIQAETNGMQNAFYVPEQTGIYTLRLRANSNMNDEYITQEVYLEKGNEYLISFELKDLQSTKMCTSDMNVLQKK